MKLSERIRMGEYHGYAPAKLADEVAQLEEREARLLAVARAAKEFHGNVMGWGKISISGKKLTLVDDELTEALAAVEDLLDG